MTGNLVIAVFFIAIADAVIKIHGFSSSKSYSHLTLTLSLRKCLRNNFPNLQKTSHSLKALHSNHYETTFNLQTGGSISSLNSSFKKSTASNISKILSSIFAVSLVSTTLSYIKPSLASDVITDSSFLKFPLTSDEVELTTDATYLGIGLSDVSYSQDSKSKSSNRVIVSSIQADADINVKEILKPNMILVAVNGESVEGKYNREQISQLLKSLLLIPKSSLRLVFRDPSLFANQLNTSSHATSLAVTNTGTSTVSVPLLRDVMSTRVRPFVRNAEDMDDTADNYNNIFYVKRLHVPGVVRGSARPGDVLVIRLNLYSQLKQQNNIVPHASLYYAILDKHNDFHDNILGSNNTSSIHEDNNNNDITFLTLFSKRVFMSKTKAATAFSELFPTAWNTGLLGMSTGEIRRISLPAALIPSSPLHAYSTGTVTGTPRVTCKLLNTLEDTDKDMKEEMEMPLKDVLNTSEALIYEIELLSINGE